jgi:dimethylhistidine N-methyltransferase
MKSNMPGQSSGPDSSQSCPDDFAAALLDGLGHRPKTIPCKYLYDQEGSRLFDRISELEEYYPTRTETGILQANINEMAELCGPDALLIEFGSGSSRKTRMLLDHLETPAAYIPIDISREHLLETARMLRAQYPFLEVLPLCADYLEGFELPAPRKTARRRVVFFPGSTIGNFDPEQAVEFLRHMAEVCEPDGGLLIGVDLEKETWILERAYNDAQGVTAAFNLNLLQRANRELDAQFEPAKFQHRAVYNRAAHRVEMHLVCRERTAIKLLDTLIPFEKGEVIITEFSYKYTVPSFRALAAAAGFQCDRVWTDPRKLFALFFIKPEAPTP